MEENNESKEFWEEKKRETGKDIIFRSFAKFIGEKDRGANGQSGLLYATDERVYFEDFEKTSMFDFLMKRKRKYEKFTMNFLIDDAAEMRKVSEASAQACINGEITEGKPQSALSSLFNTPAWEIKFKSGNSYFFELFEPKELLSLLNKK